MLSNDLLLDLVDESAIKLQRYKEIAESCEISIQPFEEALHYFSKLKKALYTHRLLEENYKEQLRIDSCNIIGSFGFQPESEISQMYKDSYKINFEHGLNEFERNITIANFNLNIFSKFNFFNNNIVAIGANGETIPDSV